MLPLALIVTVIYFEVFIAEVVFSSVVGFRLMGNIPLTVLYKEQRGLIKYTFEVSLLMLRHLSKLLR